jgi:N-acylneuraminate cytidylyltransferase/CMP-N,N'-diacetyllegionaminic acid synthase
MKAPEILFLITARGGSKGVPGKNKRRIGPHSLIGYKAISAKKSKYCTRLVISTDSEELQEDAARYGAEVPFTRPRELATDTAKSDDVVLHAMAYFENEEGRRYDAIMLLEPASPFARARDFDAAVEIYVRHKANLVVGVKPVEVNSIFVGPLGEDGRADRIIEKFVSRPDVRRQAFEQEYTMNGALYLFGWDYMKTTRRMYADPANTYGHPMDRFHSAEIDTLYDMRLAELFAKNGDIDLGEWS